MNKIEEKLPPEWTYAVLGQRGGRYFLTKHRNIETEEGANIAARAEAMASGCLVTVSFHVVKILATYTNGKPQCINRHPKKAKQNASV
jgi:hypothetical protein